MVQKNSEILVSKLALNVRFVNKNSENEVRQSIKKLVSKKFGHMIRNTFSVRE